MRLPARIAVFTVYMIALRSTPLLPVGRLLSVSDKISALRRIRFQFFIRIIPCGHLILHIRLLRKVKNFPLKKTQKRLLQNRFLYAIMYLLEIKCKITKPPKRFYCTHCAVGSPTI